MKILIASIWILTGLVAFVICAPFKKNNSENIMEQWTAYKVI